MKLFPFKTSNFENNWPVGCLLFMTFFLSGSISLRAQSAEMQNRESFLISAMELDSQMELKSLVEKYVAEAKESNLPPDYCGRNCEEIVSNGSDMALVGSEPAALTEISELVYQFLVNSDSEPWMADSIATRYSGESGYLSKGVIRFSFDSEINANVLLAVEEAVKGLSMYRGFLAQRYYHKDFNALNSDAQSELNSKLRAKLVISDKVMSPPPPPAPPAPAVDIQDLGEEEEEEDVDWFDPPQP